LNLSGVAAKGAAATLSGQWVKFVLQFAGLAILARMLDPRDYGLITMVTALTGVAILLGDFGLSMASIQSQTITRDQRSNLFWINVSIGLACSVAVLLLAHPIAAFYGNAQLIPVSRVLSIVFIIEAIAAQFRAEATRNFRFKWMAGADISSQAMALGLAVAMAAAGFGYWALVGQQIMVSFVTAAVLIVGAHWRPGLPNREPGMRALIRYGVNTLGVQVVNYMSSNADAVVLGRISGATVTGLYGRAVQLFRLPLQQIAAPMTRVALPVLSRIQDAGLYDAYVRRAQLVLTYSLGGAFFVAAALSTPLIEIVLGEKWKAAAPLFCILAIGGVFQALGYVYYWIFLSKNLTGLQLKFSVITRLAMIGLIVLGSLWGAIGVATATSLGLALNWIVLTVFAVPKSGVLTGRLVREAARPIVVFAGAVGIAYPLSLYLDGRAPVWIALLALVITLIAYFAIVYLAVPPVRRDIREILRTVSKVRASG
jgi:PST family polysaccharide transporter